MSKKSKEPSKNGEAAGAVAPLAEAGQKLRKAIITIETRTSLSHKELLNVQSLVFGCVRRKRLNARGSRQTIKRAVPKWAGHDTVGVIDQVQVNVVGRR